MVPLDGDGPGDSTKSPSARASSGPSSARTPAPGTNADTGIDTDTGSVSGSAPDPAGTVGPAPSTPSEGTTGPEQPSPTPTPPRTTPATPADLGWGDPVRKDTDKRGCEKVTVAFHNSGGTAVRSGTVTFGTHIIGALGIDWGTVESTADLPVPIGPGARKNPTWTVCVDAWRVPLGMHIETRDVSVRWSQHP